mgnify:CR=1 FL=1
MIDKVAVSSDTLQLWGINDIVALKKGWIGIENLLRLPPITKHTLKLLPDGILRCGSIREKNKAAKPTKERVPP